MTDRGFKAFGERLRGLCDAVGRKPPGESGMAIWWETLKDLPDWDAAEALTKWGREQSKPPAPADLYRMACNHGTDRRERTWNAQKAEESKPWIGVTEVGRKAIDNMYAMLARGRRAPGTWWADQIRERVANGEKMPFASVVMANEVPSQMPTREPGEDSAQDVA